MEHRKRVLTERRDLCRKAHERWRASRPEAATVSRAERSAAGIPRLAVGAVSRDQQERFRQRELLRRTFASAAYREVRVTAERQIGATLDFVDLPPDEQALKAGRPVVRIVTLPGAGMVPEGFATGFLVGPDILITNHHVFRDKDEARGAGAQFLYERAPGGVREGLIFELDPDRFFLNDKGLDYALVAVKPTSVEGAPLSQFQFLPLIGVTGKIRKGDRVNIIQHPEGRPKQYALANNRLLDLRDDGFLLYETDTLEGSSGAPVFSQHWDAVGLHHCGVPCIEDGMLLTRDGRRLPLDAEVADSDLIWLANEGVRVSALVESLSRQRMERPEHQAILAHLLELSSDPLRLVLEKSPMIASSAAMHAPAKMEHTEMAQNVFQFSGPVTISIVTSNGSPSTGTVVSLAPIAPVRPAQPEFREKKLKFDENYKQRTKHGYQTAFLESWEISVPSVTAAHDGEPLKDDRGEVWIIPYYHYSLVMNAKRRLLAWAASNVDYSRAARKYTRSRKEYGGEDWRLDPRVALEAPCLQIEDADFYAPATKIDRGHIVRREDSAWGRTAREAEYANSDTYHWTNCTPQSEGFNQSRQDGLWGSFEEHIQKEVAALGGRMVVFAGPVLNPEDPEHAYEEGATIQVPMEFWKIVACVGEENGKRQKLAYGFVFDQTEPIERLGFEKMKMDDYEVYQMPITEIGKKTGLSFDPGLVAADVMKSGGAPESIRGFKGKRIRTREGVVLR